MNSKRPLPVLKLKSVKLRATYVCRICGIEADEPQPLCAPKKKSFGT